MSDADHFRSLLEAAEATEVNLLESLNKARKQYRFARKITRRLREWSLQAETSGVRAPQSSPGAAKLDTKGNEQEPENVLKDYICLCLKESPLTLNEITAKVSRTEVMPITPTPHGYVESLLEGMWETGVLSWNTQGVYSLREAPKVEPSEVEFETKILRILEEDPMGETALYTRLWATNSMPPQRQTPSYLEYVVNKLVKENRLIRNDLGFLLVFNGKRILNESRYNYAEKILRTLKMWGWIGIHTLIDKVRNGALSEQIRSTLNDRYFEDMIQDMLKAGAIAKTNDCLHLPVK